MYPPPVTVTAPPRQSTFQWRRAAQRSMGRPQITFFHIPLFLPQTPGTFLPASRKNSPCPGTASSLQRSVPRKLHPFLNVLPPIAQAAGSFLPALRKSAQCPEGSFTPSRSIAQGVNCSFYPLRSIFQP